MSLKLSVLLVACLFACAFAQSDLPNNSIPLPNATLPNATVPVPVAVQFYTLATALGSCPQRDQILRLNQLLSIENVNLAFFTELQNELNNVSTTANVGLPAGVDVVTVRSNLSTVINQINAIISFLNSTITSGCSSLSSDDQDYCYAWAPCSYSFGNVSAITNSSVAAAGNHTGNSTIISSNGTASSNLTMHSNGSSASNATTNATTTTTGLVPSASAVRTALSQGWYMSDQSVNYIASSVLLVSNVTLQLQLMEFEVVHAQQSAWFRYVTEQQIFATPVVFGASSLNAYSRPAIVSQYASFVTAAGRQCCEAFRGVSAAH